MSGTISNKNRLREGLEYAACLQGHREPNSLTRTIHQCCICFQAFPLTCLAVSMFELVSKKQKAKIILIGLHVVEKILVKRKRQVSGAGSG